MTTLETTTATLSPSSLLAPGVHHFNTDPFCWYVIEDAGRLTLVDAGFPGHYRAFIDGIRGLGYSARDVDAIVLTHAHADHTGFADRVRRESGASVYAHEAEVAKASRRLQLPWPGLVSNAWRPFGGGILLNATLHGIFRCVRVPEVTPVDDGATLDIPGSPRVIHTPGHTPGHIMLHMPERRVLLAGDAVVTQNLKTGRAQPPRVPHRSLNMNDTDARTSLKHFADLGEITLLTGHGRPWRGEARTIASGNL